MMKVTSPTTTIAAAMIPMINHQLVVTGVGVGTGMDGVVVDGGVDGVGVGENIDGVGVGVGESVGKEVGQVSLII